MMHFIHYSILFGFLLATPVLHAQAGSTGERKAPSKKGAVPKKVLFTIEHFGCQPNQVISEQLTNPNGIAPYAIQAGTKPGTICTFTLRSQDSLPSYSYRVETCSYDSVKQACTADIHTVTDGTSPALQNKEGREKSVVATFSLDPGSQLYGNEKGIFQFKLTFFKGEKSTVAGKQYLMGYIARRNSAPDQRPLIAAAAKLPLETEPSTQPAQGTPAPATGPSTSKETCEQGPAEPAKDSGSGAKEEPDAAKGNSAAEKAAPPANNEAPQPAEPPQPAASAEPTQQPPETPESTKPPEAPANPEKPAGSAPGSGKGSEESGEPKAPAQDSPKTNDGEKAPVQDPPKPTGGKPPAPQGSPGTVSA